MAASELQSNSNNTNLYKTKKSPKIESLLEGGGELNFLLERGDKLEKVVGCHFFITLQFNHIYCVWGKVRFPLLLFGSSVF